MNLIDTYTGRAPEESWGRRAAAPIARGVLVVLASIAMLLAAGPAQSRDASTTVPWRQSAVPTMHVDNDLFAPSNRDRDYTGGFAVSMPRLEQPGRWSPERWLGGLGAPRAGQPSLHSLQFQVLAFTPGALAEAGVLESDRPYASLVALTAARQRIDDEHGYALYVSLTIGMLGLSAAESLHRAVHRATGTELPEGYSHQVSSGGEPTAKLTVARRQLLAGGGLGRGTDLWITTGGSVGYLTEATAAIAMRWGERGTPWWASGVELGDYAPAPDFGIGSLGPEVSLDAGLKLRARAYNAFLQGQLRHSDHRVNLADTELVVAEGWLGGTVAVSQGWRVAIHLIAQTGELRRGEASRAHLRGSVAVTYRF